MLLLSRSTLNSSVLKKEFNTTFAVQKFQSGLKWTIKKCSRRIRKRQSLEIIATGINTSNAKRLGKIKAKGKGIINAFLSRVAVLLFCSKDNKGGNTQTVWRRTLYLLSEGLITLQNVPTDKWAKKSGIRSCDFSLHLQSACTYSYLQL